MTIRRSFLRACHTFMRPVCGNLIYLCAPPNTYDVDINQALILHIYKTIYRRMGFILCYVQSKVDTANDTPIINYAIYHCAHTSHMHTCWLRCWAHRYEYVRTDENLSIEWNGWLTQRSKFAGVIDSTGRERGRARLPTTARTYSLQASLMLAIELRCSISLWAGAV